MSAHERMPAVFIGHGSPMNTLELNRFTLVWRALGQSLPRPRAVLAISAHWYINSTAVTAMPTPRVIHDFYGFPRKLFEFDYPAPGAPDIAREIAEIVQPSLITLDHDSWGIDHGTWSVLAHVLPRADVPVLQLSIHAGEDIDYHLELGAKLAPLRERGILILASGNVVHNLRRVTWDREDHVFDWARDFDAAAKDVLTHEPQSLARLAHHPAYALAVPTAEHFLPLAYLAGLCSAAGQTADVLIDAGTLGAITMTSYTLGCPSLSLAAIDEGEASKSPPCAVPPEHTNI